MIPAVFLRALFTPSPSIHTVEMSAPGSRIRTIETAGSIRATAADEPATITASRAFILIPEQGLNRVTASAAQNAAMSAKNPVVR